LPPCADEIVQHATGSSDKASIQLFNFMKSLQNRGWCEHALQKVPHQGKPTFFVRPGFEVEFRARAMTYVTGENADG
jgi:hypothetical protein